MRVFKKRENPLVFKGFSVKSHLKMKTCFYEVRHNPKSEQLGSGFVVCDSVSGPIGVTKKNDTFFSQSLSCNVPGRSVTTLLPGGSCWGLVTVEEIVGGYLNAFSCWENVFGGRQ